MSKILFINIDRNFRSVYLAETASAYLKTNAASQITLITSKGSEVLESTGLFANILYLDTDDFFSKSKTFSNETFEKEVVRFLSPVIHTEWESIANFSSNMLGSMMLHFLKGKIILGPHISAQSGILTHSSFSSFLILRENNSENHFHCSYLYRSILNIKENAPQFPVPLKNEAADLAQKFEELRQKTQKKNIILIDTNIKRTGQLTSMNFLVEFYNSILQDENYLPVFYSTESRNESYLINKLSEQNNGEIYIINSENPAHLSVIKNVSLLVTDDLYLKSVADLAGRPTVFLYNGKNLPFSDFSMTEKSTLVASEAVDSNLVPVLKDLLKNTLEGTKIGTITDHEIYQTNVLKSLPWMVPVRVDIDRWQSSKNFTKGYLETRYLSKLEKLEMPSIMISKSLYKKIITEEREKIRVSMSKFLLAIKQDSHSSLEEKIDDLESADGILSLGIHHTRFRYSYEKDSRNILEHIRASIKDMLEFLEKEENL